MRVVPVIEGKAHLADGEGARARDADSEERWRGRPRPRPPRWPGGPAADASERSGSPRREETGARGGERAQARRRREVEEPPPRPRHARGREGNERERGRGNAPAPTPVRAGWRPRTGGRARRPPGDPRLPGAWRSRGRDPRGEGGRASTATCASVRKAAAHTTTNAAYGAATAAPNRRRSRPLARRARSQPQSAERCPRRGLLHEQGESEEEPGRDERAAAPGAGESLEEEDPSDEDGREEWLGPERGAFRVDGQEDEGGDAREEARGGARRAARTRPEDDEGAASPESERGNGAQHGRREPERASESRRQEDQERGVREEDRVVQDEAARDEPRGRDDLGPGGRAETVRARGREGRPGEGEGRRERAAPHGRYVTLFRGPSQTVTSSRRRAVLQEARRAAISSATQSATFSALAFFAVERRHRVQVAVVEAGGELLHEGLRRDEVDGEVVRAETLHARARPRSSRSGRARARGRRVVHEMVRGLEGRVAADGPAHARTVYD